MARTADAEGHQGGGSAATPATAQRRHVAERVHPKAAGRSEAAGGREAAAGEGSLTVSGTEDAGSIAPGAGAGATPTGHGSSEGNGQNSGGATSAEVGAPATSPAAACAVVTPGAAAPQAAWTPGADKTGAKLPAQATASGKTTGAGGSPLAAASPGDPAGDAPSTAAGSIANANEVPGNAGRTTSGIGGIALDTSGASLDKSGTSLDKSDTSLDTSGASAGAGRTSPAAGAAGALRAQLPWLEGKRPAVNSDMSTVGRSEAPRRSVPLNPNATQHPGATPSLAGSKSATATGDDVAVRSTVPSASAHLRLAHETGFPGAGAIGRTVASTQTGASSAQASTVAGHGVGARLQQTIETIHATVALASRQGAAQAQITLEPAELGAVRIHLSQTSEGIIARVSAQTAAGAQAIASGRSELHSTLSSLGVSLLRLDVGAFGQQEAQAGGHAPQRSEQRQSRLPSDEGDAEELQPVTSTSTVALSAGSALIDVLA